MDELRAWAGTPAEPRPTHRTLDPEDVAAVARSGAMTLGGHTVTHPRLSAHRPARQREEIVRSKARAEELGGKPVRHFAYPFGGLRDYSGRTAALVAEAGYASACATWEGTATSATDPWQMPRVQVPDVDGEAFSELLATWFER
jgi:peptidoglycan/xylan/chitin deacetylase (PgdA/CDA1 family)